MSLCINPRCPQPYDPQSNLKYCSACGTELVLGQSIGHQYRAQRCLSGTEAVNSGFGIIYEVVEGTSSKILKVLQSQYNNNSKVVELFKQEADVLKKFRGKSSGIPVIDDYFTHPTERGLGELLHCIIMEKVNGVTLNQWLENQHPKQPINAKQAVAWLQEIVEILALMHGENYFHRDIKPDNIMLRNTGKLVLIDFGTARDMTASYMAKINQRGITRIESQGFTPPEQMQGQAVPQSDFFALGRSFTQLLTGKHPDSMYDPMDNVLRWERHTRDLPPALIDLLNKMMADRARERHQNTTELLQHIEKVRRSLEKIKVVSAKISVAPWRRRKFLLLLAGSGLGSVWLWENLKPKPTIIGGNPSTPQLTPTPTKPPSPKPTATPEPTPTPKPTPSFRNFTINLPNNLTMPMIAVQGGTFTIGSLKGVGFNDEQLQTQITIPNFYMSQYLITQSQWFAVMGDYEKEKENSYGQTFREEFRELSGKFKDNDKSANSRMKCNGF
ncbi:MAG: protein kinase [Pseudanabaena sp. ELA607]